jgi:cancer susceptibility candidate protein 1
MDVKMPSSVDLETTIVRGLWFKRDFFSDTCPSFYALGDKKFERLLPVVQEEVKVRKQMQANHMEQMRAAREEYEMKLLEIQRLKEEEEAAKKSKSKSKVQQKPEPAKKKKKKKNIGNVVFDEPPIVDDATYVDVDEEYCVYEKMKIDEEREKLSPKKYNLNFYDVNMRQHHVLGGIYKLDILERPIQTKEINFQLFVDLIEHPNVLKYKQFQRDFFILPDGSENLEGIDSRESGLNELIKVQIKLPTTALWFSCPMICRYEKTEVENVKNEVDDEKETFFTKPNNLYKKKIRLHDFKLSSLPDQIELSTLVKHYLMAIMPDEWKSYYDKIEDHEKRQRAWNYFREENKFSALTLEEFLRNCELKDERPRDLFPHKFCNKIKIINEPKIVKVVSEEKIKVLKKTKSEMDVNVGEIPLKNEPITLSQLINKFRKAHEKLIPKFKDIDFVLFEDGRESVLFDEQQVKKKVSKKKTARVSIASKSVSVKRKSNLVRRKSKLSRKSSMLSEETRSESFNTFVESIIEEPEASAEEPIGKWTTKDIHEVSFNADEKIVTFYTGCIGFFGIAAEKYCNMPYRNWMMYPTADDEDKCIVLRVDTQFVKIQFNITKNGYTFDILMPRRAPIQEYTKPVKIGELRRASLLLLIIFLKVFYFINTDSVIDEREFVPRCRRKLLYRKFG